MKGAVPDTVPVPVGPRDEVEFENGKGAELPDVSIGWTEETPVPVLAVKGLLPVPAVPVMNVELGSGNGATLPVVDRVLGNIVPALADDGAVPVLVQVELSAAVEFG